MKEMIINGKPEGDVMTLHPKRSLWAGSRLMRYTWLLLLLMIGMTQQARSQSWIIGAPDPSIGASASFSALVQFALFDVMHPAGVVIDSVDVYPTSGPGQPFTIVIQNSSQNVIASWSGTTTVASGQPQRIKLDLHIPQGTGYRWGFSVNPGMTRNSTGGVYPYTVPGVMSITGNTFNVVYYYFFYNIRIHLPTPPQNHDAGIAAITSPANTASPGNNDVIVTLENFGSDTLTSATIGWSVNGVTQTPFPWTGSINPSTSAPGILLGSYNFPLGSHILKAWSSMPNGQTDSIAQNDTATKTVIVCILLSGTFTVGGAAADYPTLSAAVAAVSACGVSGPVTFNILPGVYNEQIIIPGNCGTSAINNMTFQSYTGVASDVLLTYSPTTIIDNFVIKLDGADFITIQNITIRTGTTGTYGRVIELSNGANYNNIIDNIIESIPGTNSNSTAGIYSGSTLDEYNIISGNTIRYGYSSIYMDGPASTENGNIIINNIMENYFFYGIFQEYQRNYVINDNTLSNASNSGDVKHLICDYCYGGSIVTNNRIHGTGGSISNIMNITINGTAADRALLANNILCQSTPTAGFNRGLYLAGSSYVRIYHNTISVQGTGLSRGFYVGSGNSNIEFINNTVTNFGGGYAIYGGLVNLANFSTQCNYNNYYTTGSYLAYAGVSVPDLAAWKSTTSLDNNSISVDPVFYSVNNLTPSAASVNNLGTPSTLTLVPDDINGVARNPLSPDMGAIEFDPIAFEAANLGVVEPAGGCNLGLETVKIRINNRGGQAILGGLTASYQKVGSATIVTETVTASIPSGDTLLYTFSTPVDMSTTLDTTYHLVSWINLLGDPVPENDTAWHSLNSLVSPPAPQVANGYVPFGQSATVSVLNPDTNQIYFWYDNPTATTAVDTGVSHTTPPLYANTIYYVDALYEDGFSAVTIGVGTSIVNTVPFYGGYSYGWSSCIYNKNEINAFGFISYLSYYVENTTLYPMLDQRIYMAQTINNGVLSDYSGTNGMTLVYQGKITWVGPGWNTIALATPFFYNGFSNLNIQYENHSGVYSSGFPSFRATSTTTYQAAYRYADGSFPSTYGTRTYNRPNIKLEGGSNGCLSSRTPDTVIVSAPVVTVNAGADKIICQGDTTQLNSVVSGGVPPYSYIWNPATSLNNNTIPNPLAYPLINTTYDITVSDQNSDWGSDEIIVEVNPLPSVTFTPESNIHINTPSFPLTTGQPAGGTYSGPGVSGGIFNPNAAGGGTHTLTYTFTDPVTGCTGSATAAQFVDPIPGMDKSGSQTGISIYPNPSQGKVVLTLRTADKDIRLEVLDAQGKVLMERNLINTNSRYELDMTHLPAGIYMIKAIGTTEYYQQNLLIQ